MGRTFEDRPASRERVPLLIGLVGASSSGKTMSALRLATGIQRVAGSDIAVIDSEARRSLWYADRFKFRHLDFHAPFGPLDYLAAVEHFIAKGARNLVIDSASHIWEGPGGVLESHTAEVERLTKLWKSTPEKVQLSAWAKPKSELRRFLNTILQMNINIILTWRAKEKLKVIPGQQPKPLGFMPIAPEEAIYEMSLNCLLYPGSGGVPSWQPDEMGERAIIKLPDQFKSLFAAKKPLDEDTGEAMARWAEGGATPPTARQSAVSSSAASAELSVDIDDAEAEAAGKRKDALLVDIAAEIKSRCHDSPSRKAAMLSHFGVAAWGGGVDQLEPDRLEAGLASLRGAK